MHSGPLFRNPTTLFRAPLFRAFSVALRQKCVDLDSGLRKSLWLDTLQIQSAVLWVFWFLLVLVPFKVFPTSLYFLGRISGNDHGVDGISCSIDRTTSSTTANSVWCSMFTHSFACHFRCDRFLSIFLFLLSLLLICGSLARYLAVSCCCVPESALWQSNGRRWKCVPLEGQVRGCFIDYQLTIVALAFACARQPIVNCHLM